MISGIVIPPALFFFLKIAAAIRGRLWFHINFWNVFSISSCIYLIQVLLRNIISVSLVLSASGKITNLHLEIIILKYSCAEIRSCIVNKVFCPIFFLKVTYSTLCIKELWKSVHIGQLLDLKEQECILRDSTQIQIWKGQTKKDGTNDLKYRYFHDLRSIFLCFPSGYKFIAYMWYDSLANITEKHNKLKICYCLSQRWDNFGSLNKIGSNLFLKFSFFKPWLVWLSGLSARLQTKHLPVQFPVSAHVWVASQVPRSGWGTQEATTQ